MTPSKTSSKDPRPMRRAGRCLDAAVFLCFISCLVLNGCGGTSSSTSTPGTQGAPSAATPSISSVAPTNVPAGSAAFTLTVNGTNFETGSVVEVNGVKETTTYVSATELKAAIPASQVASGTQLQVRVLNGTVSSDTSNVSEITVTNPAPVIVSLTPSTIDKTFPPTIAVTGTGFVPTSVLQLNGNARETTFVDSTRINFTVTATDLEAPGTDSITIENSAPGGGTSAPAALNVTLVSSSKPVVSSLSPAMGLVGAPDTTVTVTGSGFTKDAAGSLGGYPLNTTYVSPTDLSIVVPASFLAATGTYNFMVRSLGGSSNQVPFPVVNPVPVLTSISPATVTAGSGTFMLYLEASNLVSGSQVLVNGTALETFPRGGGVAVEIDASEITEVGSLPISIVNPAPGGGTSATLNLKVIGGDTRVRTVDLTANALTWDAKQQRIYAAVAAASSVDANTIAAIDPTTGKVVATQAMPSEPKLVSISDDQQFLYVGMTATATVARLKLPSLLPDIQWQAGVTSGGGFTLGLTDLQVAPGFPHTVATAQQDSDGAKVLAIYDDGVIRPNVAAASSASGQVRVDHIQWGADTSTVYGATVAVSGGTELTFAVDSTGATLTGTRAGAFGDFAPFIYDRPSALLYDGYGNIADAATGRRAGNYTILTDITYEPNPFFVDSAQQRVFFLNGLPYQEYSQYAQGTEIQSFDQKQHTFIGKVFLSQTSGGGGSLIRWGASGLAFACGSTVYLLDGPFVTPGAAPSSSTGTFAIPAPILSSITPESVPAGSPDTTLVVKGQGFSESTTVTWNGNQVAVQYVSPTELELTLPAASLSAPIGGPILAVNGPLQAISNPLGFTVSADMGNGMQFHAMNVSGSDLVWNSAANALYVAVPEKDLVHGDSIASIDPIGGNITGMVASPNGPELLAISDDDKYLYVGLDGIAAVQRYVVPALTPDLSLSLGLGDTLNSYSAGSAQSCGFAAAVKVAPGTPQTIAVTQGNTEIEPAGCGALVIFDGATPRPQTLLPVAPYFADFSELAWGEDATALYAQTDSVFSPQQFSSLAVSASGVTLNQTFPNRLNLGRRLHFDGGTGMVYTDSGLILKPSDGTTVGSFQASGLMVPDSKLGRAFFLGTTSGGNGYVLQIYNLANQTLLDSIEIPGVIGYPTQMVRWGSNGIAFTTLGANVPIEDVPGMTYALSGPRINGVGVTALPGAATEHVRLSWNPNLHRTQSKERSATHN